MSLRVAPCPRCQNALVFGERQCRTCGQTFQYGDPGPPLPSPAQIVEALTAAGLAAPPALVAHVQQAQAQAQFQAQVQAQAQTSRPAMSQTQAPAQRAPSVPLITDLDTGRFEQVGAVPVVDIPGFVDSSLYKAFTPAHVDTVPVLGLDAGRFDEVGAVAPAFTPGLEATARDEVGEVFVQPVDGIVRSDLFAVRGDVAAGPPVDGFEPSAITGAPTAAPRTPAARKVGELDKALCRCGETHRLPRCPACGSSHPSLV